MDNRSNLNLPLFWDLPEKSWRNITKYDMRYYCQSGCTCTKSEAHQAYSQDVQRLLESERPNSNRSKTLKSCQMALKSAANNPGNIYFWNQELANVAAIVSLDAVAEQEMEVMERVTAVTALHSYNKKSASSHGIASTSSSSSSKGDTTNDSNSNNNNVQGQEAGNESRKRKLSQGDGEANPTSKRTSRQTLADQFLAFKKKVMKDAALNHEFSMENGVPELIALSDVMLLKPSQFTDYTRKHFGDQVLNDWHQSIVDNVLIDVSQEAADIANSLVDLVYDLKKKRINTREAVQKLVAMSVDKEDSEAQLLIGLSNMIQKLPHKTLLPTVAMGETELWSSVFDPILSALLSDPDRDILLRWTNIVPDDGSASEVVRMQPDAIICQIDQLSWGIPLGYGEAKLEEMNPNIDSLANDLLRLAIMNSKAISKSKMSGVLGFQIHGYKLKIYLTQKMPNSPYYTMTEVLAITFPKSIQELDLLTSRANIESLLSLYTVFWTNCCNKHDVEDEDEEPTSPRLDISTIQSIKEGCVDRSRKCPLQY